MRHSHSPQVGNNKAGRVEKGAIGCVAIFIHLVTHEKASKLILTMAFLSTKARPTVFLG